MQIRFILLISSLAFSLSLLHAQNRAILTAMPSLQVSANAQIGGFGEIGVVAPPGYYAGAAAHNPALLARNEAASGVFLNYSPWLRGLGIPSIHLLQGGNFYTFENGRHAIGTHLHYFSSQGSFIDLNPPPPNFIFLSSTEFSSTFSYAYALSEKFSIGMGIKYLHANNTAIGPIIGLPTRAINTMAGDLGVHYQGHKTLANGTESRISLGLSMLNLGPRVTFFPSSAIRDFLPTTLKLGGMMGWTFPFDNKASIDFDMAYQMDKLLVPSMGPQSEVSSAAGIFTSFADAPGGLRGELQEIAHLLGVMGSLDYEGYRVTVRTGFYLAHEDVSNNKYQTIGIGIGRNGLQVAGSLIMPFEQNHPLARTAKVTVAYNYSLGK